MGKCSSTINEIRFVIEEELTQVYVFVTAEGDCPLGVQGSHHKTFPKSQSVKDIMNGEEIAQYLDWPLDAP